MTDYHDLSGVQIQLNEESPFEFVDEVEVKEMNILLYNKYVYYSIYNKQTQKTYHGIYDIVLNKIMFNTDVNIDTYIPYSSISMLAITKDTAYQICAIKNDNNQCISECTSGLVIRDVDGNKCATSCPNEKYLLVPDLICLTECDESIYISNNTKHCGLCKDMDSSKPYRLIGSNKCLETIPEGAYEYNLKAHLLKCKGGYIFQDNTCSPHCYPTCKRCSEYSEDENNQKCISCNNGYYLDGNQCLSIPTTIIQIPTTIPIIPTTIIIPPTTIIIPPNTIIIPPTTVPISPPTTIKIEMPTTIPITIPKEECPDEKCLTCNEESNKLGLCLSCNEAKGYKKVNYTLVLTNFLNCIKKEDPKFKKYYFNEISQEYRPCYKTCKTCLKSGNPEKNNCFECEKGYMFRPGNNKYNNCVAYSEFYYMSAYNQYKSLDIYQCPEEVKYYIKKNIMY